MLTNLTGYPLWSSSQQNFVHQCSLYCFLFTLFDTITFAYLHPVQDSTLSMSLEHTVCRASHSLRSTSAGPLVSSHEESTASRMRRHKVVVENVSQEKKKLLSVVFLDSGRMGYQSNNLSQLTFTTTPPDGYLFVPAGNPELTNAMKDFARRGNHKVYAVSVGSTLCLVGVLVPLTQP